MLEPVTGGNNPQEDPELAAVREVKEETGYSVKGVDYIGSFYSAPGYISQKAHVYIAYLDQYIGNSLEEHEIDFQLKTKEMTIGDVKDFVKTHPTSPYLSVGIHHILLP